MTPKCHQFISVVCCLFLAGCLSAPKNRHDSLPFELPSSYRNANQLGEDSPFWLQSFDDPTLTSLINEALDHNYNLQAAASRLEIAHSNLGIATGALLPNIDARFRASRVQRNASQGFRLLSNINNNFQPDFAAAWELDLWGKIRNRRRSAFADLQVSEADYRGATLSLAANTLQSWFNLTESELQVRLSERTVSSFENNQSIVQDGYNRGVYRALDVHLVRANVLSAKSNLDANRARRDATARALEVILGRYPGNEIEAATVLPTLPSPIPAGLPSDLLRRRPDIVAAERNLAGAHEDTLAAAKELLPTISLSVSGGRGSSELGDLLDPDRNIWNLAGNVTQPLFRGGRLRSAWKLTQASEQAALANFANITLQALREVESLLAESVFLEEQEASLNQAAEESKLAENLAWEEYQKGLRDITTVLDSQRRSFNAQSTFIRIQNLRLQNRINLHLAMGGDFLPPATTPSSGSDHTLATE